MFEHKKLIFKEPSFFRYNFYKDNSISSIKKHPKIFNSYLIKQKLTLHLRN